MHIKPLPSRDSDSIAEYSAKKLRTNKAEVIHRSSSQALRQIRQYENSPKLDARAKNLGLHFEISPGKDEQGDENRITELAETFLNEMGLNGQPWLLVRHSDIKRTHYHLVTTRAQKNGKLYPSDWLRKRAFDAAQRSILSMGYSFGKRDIYQKAEHVDFQKERGNIFNQIESVYYHVLELPIKSREEFFREMRKRNVDVFISTKCRAQKLIFVGLSDDGGRAVSPIYNIDPNGCKLRMVDNTIMMNCDQSSQKQSHLDYRLELEEPIPEYEMFEDNNLLESSFKIRDSRMLATMVKEILRMSVSHEDFENKCGEAGIIITSFEDYASGLHIEFSGFNGRSLVDYGDIRRLFTKGELDLIVHDNVWHRKHQLLTQADREYRGRIQKR